MLQTEGIPPTRATRRSAQSRYRTHRPTRRNLPAAEERAPSSGPAAPKWGHPDLWLRLFDRTRSALSPPLASQNPAHGLQVLLGSETLRLCPHLISDVIRKLNLRYFLQDSFLQQPRVSNGSFLNKIHLLVPGAQPTH